MDTEILGVIADRLLVLVEAADRVTVLLLADIFGTACIVVIQLLWYSGRFRSWLGI